MNNESFQELPPIPDEPINADKIQNEQTSQRVLASISGELVASLDEHDMLERTARLALSGPIQSANILLNICIWRKKYPIE